MFSCYIPNPSNGRRFHHCLKIRQTVITIMLPFEQFYPVSRYFLPLRTTDSLPTTLFRGLQSMLFLENGRYSDRQSTCTVPTAYPHITQCN